MHHTVTGPGRTGLHTAVMAAIASVPVEVKAHALTHVTAAVVSASAYVGRADYDHDQMEDLHEQVCRWACIACENGATDPEIRAAKGAGDRYAGADHH